MKHISFSVSFVVAFIVAHLIMVNDATRPATEAPAQQSAVQLLRAQHDDLTDWQLLTLAICWTESKCNPAAVGNAGDRGILQITPIYVAEVNRIAGTGYQPEDAHDTATALQMFDTLQSHYNPERDIDTAIRYHNRGAAYRRAVLDNYELLRRYEAARKAVTAK